MNPKDGSAGTATSPAAPLKPAEAAKADPGEATEAKGGSKSPGGSGSSTKTAPGETESGGGGEEPVVTTWIGIELKDTDDKPVANEPVLVTDSTGALFPASTGADGKVKVEGVADGPCKISFPLIDKREWKKA